jgi:tetratricopeptide (TPR) repeat protein
MPMARAQSTQPTQQSPPPTVPAQSDNPFPGEPQAAKPQQAKPQSSQQQTSPQQGTPQSGKPQTPAPDAKPGSDNPFPGEDVNAPILPTGPGDAPAAAPRPDDAAGDQATATRRRSDDPDGDPVRTPDPAGLRDSDGFSSSRSGGPDLPMEDTTDARPGKSVKNKTREQLIQEDLDVGGFYFSKKNWKAAQQRYASAFALDRENPDAVWGMAEAERHLQMYKEAVEHYQLFLSYDPDGPHGKAARKELEEVESSLASGAKKDTGASRN